MNVRADLLVCLLALALPAHAEKADREKPVNVEADSVRVDDVKRVSVYEGHVILTQGTLMITADRIDVRQDEQGLASGEAVGKPAYFRQKMDNSEEYAEGWAQRVEYDSRVEKLKLIGQARLKRGIDELRGQLITYDGMTEYYQAVGSTSAGPGRVRAVIRPKTAPPPKP
jgi:lipopolysaccharide export system protein LptA